MPLALIDYGAGNLASVRKGLAAAGAETLTPASPADLSSASGIVVPGVGHFAATATLDVSWRSAVRARMAAGVPLLGICLGMQWLFDGSDEAPSLAGLGVIHGLVSRMEPPPAGKIPHVGWNALRVVRPARMLDGVADGSQVYFTHSFAAPLTAETIATCEHGAAFAAAVECDGVFGVQFHPEKSGGVGVRILRNFIECCRNA
jgi:imidazole glycerol-phosphate synthase subunit HisH